MISTSSIIECINPTCGRPINPVGSKECAACQTPLVYRYLWAAGEGVSNISSGEIIADRYEVMTPQIWLDSKPKELPLCAEKLPVEITTYSKCYSQYLHIPRVYDCIDSEQNTGNKILLLEAPIDDNGKLYPAISDVWEQATGVRQVYWLWQILELWQPLEKLGMAGSLLVPNNLRVRGWCVQLLELIAAPASLQQLGECWQPLAATAYSSVSEQLQSIVRLLTQQPKLVDIQKQLNHLLLSAASELPLNFKIAGATSVGTQLKQNEDACFPNIGDNIDDPQLARVSIVCDGIGGHEGGEVASQLAVQSVKLQARALLAEVALSDEPVPPDLLLSQLEASLRVVNNLICNANDTAHRVGKQRMGTTLVMALQVPQAIQTPMGWDAENSHELYIASIGDSRAYWITRDSCQLLTLDDDIATREASTGRSLYRKALTRADAGALTQALGTKEAQNLHFTLQRLIIESDGLLILCSDGFSDNNFIERTWRTEALPILDGLRTVSEGVDAWISKANLTNGHDNISLVINYCRVSPDYLAANSPYPLHLDTYLEAEAESDSDVVSVITIEPANELNQLNELDELNSQPPLDLELSSEEAPPETAPATPVKTTQTKKGRLPFVWLIGLILVLIGSVSLGLFVWWRYNPRSFNSLCRQLPPSLQRVCPDRT